MKANNGIEIFRTLKEGLGVNKSLEGTRLKRIVLQQTIYADAWKLINAIEV